MKTIFKIIVLLAFLPVLCAGTYFDPLTGQVQTTPPGMANENYADTAAAAAQTAAESHADIITANMATTDTAQDISGFKNFTVQPKFTDGTVESMFATERYVDKLISSLGARFYVTDDEEVIGGYTYRLATQAVCSATVQTVTSPVIDSASVEIASWISPAGDTFPKLISGKYDFIVGLNWEGGTGTEPVLKAFWKLQVLEADGVTIRTLATSDDSLVIGTTVETEDMFLILLEDEEIAAGERIIGSVYGKWVSGRQNATIVLSYCGALKSHWELPTNVEVLDTMYEPLGTAAALTTNMAETTENEEITGDWTHKGKLYVTKNNIIASDDIEVDVAIAAGADDGRYWVSDTTLVNDNTTEAIGYFSDRGYFYRFADVNIPQGAKIKESQLRLASSQDRADQAITIKAGFVDSATVAQPTEYADLAAYVVPPGVVTDNRIGTADRVITTTVNGTTYGFPEVATNTTFVAGMQALVDKETWVQGTADIMLIITCADGDSDNHHRFRSQEDTAAEYRPILRVTYFTETGDIETIDVEATMVRTDTAQDISGLKTFSVQPQYTDGTVESLFATENYADTQADAAQTAAQSHADTITANMAETNVANTFSEPQTFGNGITTTSLAADMIVVSDRTVAVCASGCDYTTIEDAVSHVNTLIIGDGAAVTVSIAAGVYTPTADAIQLLSPFAAAIKFVGADLVATGNATGIHLIAGSVGAWDVTFNMTNDTWQAVVDVNDWVEVMVGGTGVGTQVRGFWKVTAIDTVNDRITVRSTHKLDLETIVKGGGTYPVTVAVTIQKVPTIISTTLTSVDHVAVYMNRSPMSVEKIGIVNPGRGAGKGLVITGAGSTDFSNVYISGFGGSLTTGGSLGVYVGPQMYILLGNSIISDCRTGLEVVGGTVWASGTLITGCTKGGFSTLNGMLYAAFQAVSQGNTLGAQADFGGTVLNGFQSAVRYNTTGVSMTSFSKYGNVNDGVVENNTADYAQNVNVLLADGSYIAAPAP